MAVMWGESYYIRLEGSSALWLRDGSDPYLAGAGFANGAPCGCDFFFRTCSLSEPRCSIEEGRDPPGWMPSMSASQYVLAQSFTPSEPFLLGGIEAMLDVESPTILTAYLQDDPSGVPGVIHAQTSETFLGPGFLSFDLPTTSISAGTTYYIRISGSARWYYSEEPPYYPRGSAYVNGQLTANDFHFRACGEPVPVEEQTWGAIKAAYRDPR